ncbi:hypothetical protein [Bifidobacterium sp. SO1]|uniref:hypothetical protein n=1 Tax=Bifidobacterium sp. SO1 TaxID=2809029 RepID=UPI001BDD43C8|nr:hypothetical protein [Bifidobacterium sp. SO1]MBT1161196.1 hypothetical protein [Bifidobacterium sp. SO1]
MIITNLFPDPGLTGASKWPVSDGCTLSTDLARVQIVLVSTSDTGGFATCEIDNPMLAGRQLEFHANAYLGYGGTAAPPAKGQWIIANSRKAGGSWTWLKNGPALKDGSNTTSMQITMPADATKLQLLFFTPAKTNVNVNWSSMFLGTAADWQALQKLGLTSFTGDTMPLD